MKETTTTTAAVTTTIDKITRWIEVRANWIYVPLYKTPTEFANHCLIIILDSARARIFTFNVSLIGSYASSELRADNIFSVIHAKYYHDAVVWRAVHSFVHWTKLKIVCWSCLCSMCFDCKITIERKVDGRKMRFHVKCR